jgi:O-antigen ligase
MALASNFNIELLLTRERTDLGHKFLRFAVVSLTIISILAPVVRLNSEFCIKLDQLLLPLVAFIYASLVLAGFARPFRPNAMMAVGLLFFGCIGLSLVYGTQIIGHPFLTRDLFELVKPVFPVIFYTLACEADFSEESLRALGRFLIPAIFLICIYAYGQWFSLGFTAYLQPYYSGGLHDDGGLAHYRRVYSTLSNPNYLGMLMTWIIAAFVMRALIRVGSQFWNLLVLLTSLVTLTMTGSRYGLIDTVVAMGLIFIIPTPTQMSGRRRRLLLLATLPLVFTTILAISVSNRATLDRFEKLQDPLKENSLRMRLDGLWKDAADQFLASPLLGQGPAKIIFSDVNTDSEYLQILKQFGLIGLVPYLSLFLVPLASVSRGLRLVRTHGAWIENRRPAIYWALCLSFIMSVTALVMNIGMGTYYNLSLVAFLWMWMGIGTSCARRMASASRHSYKGNSF